MSYELNSRWRFLTHFFSNSCSKMWLTWIQQLFENIKSFCIERSAAVWSDIRKCQTQHEKVVKNCYWVWLVKTYTLHWNWTERFLMVDVTTNVLDNLLIIVSTNVACFENVVTTLLMFLSKWVPNCGVLILTGDRSRGSPGATSAAAAAAWDCHQQIKLPVIYKFQEEWGWFFKLYYIQVTLISMDCSID